MELVHELKVRNSRVQRYFKIDDGILITLTKGQATLISQCDFELVKDIPLKSQWDGHVQNYYVHLTYEGKVRTLHSYLTKQNIIQVDHINRDTLDNRRYNLRLATQQQQMFNQGRGTDIYGTVLRGVTKRKDNGRYRVRAQGLGPSQTSLGHFDSEIEAAKVWDDFMREEYKDHHPLAGISHNGICGEPTLNFIMFNFN